MGRKLPKEQVYIKETATEYGFLAKSHQDVSWPGGRGEGFFMPVSGVGSRIGAGDFLGRRSVIFCLSRIIP